MDKQKMAKFKFPLIDALLTLPKEGARGRIAICTNTTAAGQVLNELEEKSRESVCVLGTLIVNRDGAERMILNSLVHPTLKYLILFSEESLTYSPSSNLLQAIRFGFEKGKAGNAVKNGVAASPQYPNLSEEILAAFRNEIVVLPLFMSKNPQSKAILEGYFEWLKPKVSDALLEALKTANQKDKIYFDVLNKIIGLIEKEPKKAKEKPELNAKDFQNLQPPRIVVSGGQVSLKAPFAVTREGGRIRLDFKLGEKTYFLRGENDFMLGYALMKFLKNKKELFSPLEQLFLGMELGRVSSQIANNLKFPAFVRSPKLKGKTEIKLEASAALKMDRKYYYRLGVQQSKIRVMCLAFDACEEIFELESASGPTLARKLAELNRFEKYEQDILHRIDLGTQLGKAAIAAKLGYSFIQDFNMLFKTNKKELPLVIAESDTFLGMHKGIMTKIYTEGLTEPHGDVWKGSARTAIVLGVCRNAGEALKTMPLVYKLGDQDTKAMRQAYKAQLLRFDHDGSYSYGQRTRSFFGFDQLKEIPKALKKDPTRAAIIQRYDPAEDMNTFIVDGKEKFSHDPCLTHDIFFVSQNKLHSFHLARAHNIVNAYPENIFGLFDAYATTIRKKLKLESGDMFILSNRANILLLTEEQRMKKLLGEPSKPVGALANESGPYQLAGNIKPPKKNKTGVAWLRVKAKANGQRPKSSILERLENFQGTDTLQKAIDYLKAKGINHNNPVLSEFRAGENDPQGEYLVFFQCNAFGKKLHATAVFANRSLEKKNEDIKLGNYLMTRFGRGLKLPLGELTIFYVGFGKRH